MNRKVTFVCALVLALLLPSTGTGQQKKRSEKGTPTTVTGCLNKGADASHFALKDDKGKEYTVTGDSATLTKHASNHNVTITGKMERDNGKQVLKVESPNDLKMNSVCK